MALSKHTNECKEIAPKSALEQTYDVVIKDKEVAFDAVYDIIFKHDKLGHVGAFEEALKTVFDEPALESALEPKPKTKTKTK